MSKSVSFDKKDGGTVKIDPDRVESVEHVRTGFIKDDYKITMDSGTTHEISSFGSPSAKIEAAKDR